MIKPGATSITDHAGWRGFCAAAADDLTLLHRDPDGILDATLEGPAFSAVRYERVLGQIETLFPFGSLDRIRVLEVGAGYGGQALVLMSAHRVGAYSIIDLPEPFALQKAYLADRGFEVHTDGGEWADLFLSSFAVSELERELQLATLERAKGCPYGFIYWNGWLAGEVTLGETIDALPEWVRLERCPDHARNRILTWRPI